MTTLAFDFGFKRIGVSVGELITGTARPLKTIQTSSEIDWPAIQKLVDEWKPAELVVGLPLDDDGSEQAMTASARAFAKALEAHTLLAVHLADERFSSRAADDALREARASGRMSRRVRKGDRDGEAARVILEQWLASRGA